MASLIDPSHVPINKSAPNRRYWVMGNCLAGDGCPFSHDPSALVANLSVEDAGQPGAGPSFQIENVSDAFPPLQTGPDQWTNQYGGKYPTHLSAFAGNKGFPHSMQFVPGKRNGSMNSNSRPHSRPNSRHQHRELNLTAPSVDDPDAFPTLAAVGAKNKKHGKRRDNQHKETVPSSLADVVRMSPSPAAGKGKSSSKNNKDSSKGRENSAAAQAIPAPQNIPWLETGMRINQQYIKYRTEAIRHGTVRNKFLQR